MAKSIKFNQRENRNLKDWEFDKIRKALKKKQIQNRIKRNSNMSEGIGFVKIKRNDKQNLNSKHNTNYDNENYNYDYYEDNAEYV